MKTAHGHARRMKTGEWKEQERELTAEAERGESVYFIDNKVEGFYKKATRRARKMKTERG